MSAKHTPGPWKATPFRPQKYQEQLIQADEFDVATCHAYSPGTEVEALSNAHLISAAPDLLEALEEAVEWDGQDSEGVDAVWLEKAREAIAKARGAA